MELQKINHSTELSTISGALSSTTVRNSQESELRDVLTKAIAKAFQDSGQTANGPDANYLVGVMPDEIKKYHSNMRIAEIPIAIERGIRGEFGDYFGLNVLTFTNFFKSYMESEERKNEVKKLNKEPEKSLPSQEEIIEGIKKTIINAYNVFLETGAYEDYGNFVYNKMDSMGLVLLNRDRRNKIYEEAKQSLIKKKDPTNVNSVSDFKLLSAEIENINNPDSISGKDMIIKEAKKIALIVVFSDLKELETNIEDYISQREINF